MSAETHIEGWHCWTHEHGGTRYAESPDGTIHAFDGKAMETLHQQVVVTYRVPLAVLTWLLAPLLAPGQVETPAICCCGHSKTQHHAAGYCHHCTCPQYRLPVSALPVA